MTFENKVVIITGAGSGIGRTTAIQLARGGAKLSLCDVNAEGGAETVKLVEAEGAEAIFTPCDVSQASDVEAMVKATIKAFGRLDIAVNNAGVGGVMTTTEKLDEPTWNQVIDINLKGVWLCMKYELPHLVQNGGAIVNIASLAGLVGFPYNAVYSASKHGVIGLTKSTALEFARKGVRVNAVCPGFTETQMVNEMVDVSPSMGERMLKSSPMRRLGTVDEIASAIVYLASDAATFVTGHAMALDGGASAQ